VPGEEELTEASNVLEDPTSFLDGVFDRAEVVRGEDDVGDLAGDVGAGASHGDADIGLPQRRGVVDAVAGDSNDLAVGLQGSHEAQRAQKEFQTGIEEGKQSVSTVTDDDGHEHAAGEHSTVGTGFIRFPFDQPVGASRNALTRYSRPPAPDGQGRFAQVADTQGTEQYEPDRQEARPSVQGRTRPAFRTVPGDRPISIARSDAHGVHVS
jgi:hypothetical protein